MNGSVQMQTHMTSRIKMKKKFVMMVVLFQIFLFGCSTKEKEVNTSKLLSEVSTAQNEEVAKKYIGEIIITDVMVGNISCIYGGSGEQYEADKDLYLEFYTTKNASEKGKIIILLREEIIDNTRVYILKDIKFLNTKDNHYWYKDFLYHESGENNSNIDTDFLKSGLIQLEKGQGPTYHEKIIPDYILSIENDKLILTKPTDNKLFLFFWEDDL